MLLPCYYGASGGCNNAVVWWRALCATVAVVVQGPAPWAPCDGCWVDDACLLRCSCKTPPDGHPSAAACDLWSCANPSHFSPSSAYVRVCATRRLLLIYRLAACY